MQVRRRTMKTYWDDLSYTQQKRDINHPSVRSYAVMDQFGKPLYGKHVPNSFPNGGVDKFYIVLRTIE